MLPFFHLLCFRHTRDLFYPLGWWHTLIPSFAISRSAGVGLLFFLPFDFRFRGYSTVSGITEGDSVYLLRRFEVILLGEGI